MAVSTLPFLTSKLTLQTLNPKPSINFRATASSTPHSKSPHYINKNRILEVGVGLLAASMVGLTPLDAEATRVEYYATVAEPSCELNFARSGLGYCDVAVGSGEEAPYGELINC
ncbi:unnamed protein product [Ilex paraguariensis]|uniref:Uncharacterized protein n=1 Tax=Ilex paraguariensis TaxID=185542 RepID=A0ABC8UXM6_9AQUA